MKEDFLHYIWRYKKLNVFNLRTEQDQQLEILRFGDYLQDEGPDFFNAHLLIDNQKWIGTVEIHVKSSDWYIHQHETDPNYDNVILHVVWEDDIPVFNKSNTPIPTLVLKKYVDVSTLEKYHALSTEKPTLYCEKHIVDTPDLHWNLWKEKLLVERLELKSKKITELTTKTNNNWEEILYNLLLKNFGLNINGEYFEQIAQIVPFKIIKKEATSIENLEAIFFGILGMLEHEDIPYVEKLSKNFRYLSSKYQWNNIYVKKPMFYKLRPDNFPTIRLAQLAMLFHKEKHLFSKLIIENSTYEEIHQILKVNTSDFWKTHYIFNKESSVKNKNTSASFIDLIILNTIIPLRFVYYKHIGNHDYEILFDMYKKIKAEKNHIVEIFKKLNIKVYSAFDSQAFIQLKKHYCDTKNCLNCSIGHFIISND